MEKKNTNHGTQEKEKGQKKEQIVITFSAVMIMAALTMTGIYMNQKGRQRDMQQENQLETNIEMLEQEELFDFQIVDSGMVENPGRTGITAENITEPSGGKVDTVTQKAATNTSKTLTLTENTETQLSEQIMQQALDPVMFSFNGIELFTPLTESAEILIPYSMEKAVYFETLDQYKCNPAIIAAAQIDAPVCSVAAGKIIDKYWDYETGWTLEMDLGGGFKAYYGQLNNDTLEKTIDTYVAAGDVLGYVDVPTKYYAKEGSNVYFAMTKDGKPIDPMAYVK